MEKLNTFSRRFLLRRFFSRRSFENISFKNISFKRISFENISFERISFERISLEKITFVKIASEKIYFEEIYFEDIFPPRFSLPRYLQDHVCMDLDKNVQFVIIVKSNLLWSTFHSHHGLSSVCQTASSKIKCHCHLTEKSFIHPFTLKRGYH